MILRAAVTLWLMVSAVVATADNDDRGTYRSGRVEGMSIQESLEQRGESGPIMVSIPFTFRFGNPAQVGAGPAYCSPSLRVHNTSGTATEEIVIGLEYRHRSGGAAGSQVMRVGSLKPGQSELRQFHRLPVSDCDEVVSARIEVLHCVYSTGKPCADRVRALPYGAIPLSAKAP